MIAVFLKKKYSYQVLPTLIILSKKHVNVSYLFSSTYVGGEKMTIWYVIFKVVTKNIQSIFAQNGVVSCK